MKTINRISLLPMMAFLALTFTFCQGQTGSQKLTADAFEKKLSSTSAKIILDVRTPEEYADGHLANSTLVNFYDSDFKQQINKLDKSKSVFVYCKGGVRSAKAAQALTEAGFKEVYDLQGGYDSWAGAKKPTTRQ
jgi:rhodanese-related sulfurtransferase